ncbi:proline hydroxylase [Asticcacaulis biprosthecium C19]|uniref:Proline hydroxylase n=1 Tax=Asticcacaulis biprosthecium C19 TaxID=715226 RepID=F4QSN2_9CAUL|nr:2OG-Fe(II) oxygenase family protein [Asticcacaulis biprosthecium]EGF89752.1 proline hydroxylase [Asticcacaulis biprosthecium C19]
MLTLNTQFDTAGYLSRFASKGRIRLEGVLLDDDAAAVHHALEQQTPWELHLVGGNGPEVINRRELATLPESDIQNRLTEAAERAQNGLSWLRLGYELMGTLDGEALRPLADMIKSPAFARFCESLTGMSGLDLIALNAACYRPGDFVTRHTDTAARLCFEWSFTKDWRSDWGGQMLFHSPSGDIEGGIMPRLNDLALFAGDQPRSVASVAPYAGGPRFSITGRFA